MSKPTSEKAQEMNIRLLHAVLTAVMLLAGPLQLRAAEPRFVPSDSVVVDMNSGLMWQKNDNGSNVNWFEANLYCQELGEQWGLPSVEELRSLYDPALKPGIPCGSPASPKKSCMIPSHFSLSGHAFWSSQVNERTREAFLVPLPYGGSYSSKLDGSSMNDDRGAKRVLCVSSGNAG